MHIDLHATARGAVRGSFSRTVRGTVAVLGLAAMLGAGPASLALAQEKAPAKVTFDGASLSFAPAAAGKPLVDAIPSAQEDFLKGIGSDGRIAEPKFTLAARKPAENLLEKGVASTYGTGDGFQGELTACGQVFDTYVPQVAHKSLPCGTMVRVEDVKTGKSVVVEVTDRGPYIAGRVVDLSWAAFRQLDPSGPGLLDVRVYTLEDE